VDIVLVAVPLTLLLLFVNSLAHDRASRLQAQIPERTLLLVAADRATDQLPEAREPKEIQVAIAASERSFHAAAETVLSCRRLSSFATCFGSCPLQPPCIASPVALRKREWTGAFWAIGIVSLVKWLALLGR
jgi:hypothetical protein